MPGPVLVCLGEGREAEWAAGLYFQLFCHIWLAQSFRSKTSVNSAPSMTLYSVTCCWESCRPPAAVQTLAPPRMEHLDL